MRRTCEVECRHSCEGDHSVIPAQAGIHWVDDRQRFKPNVIGAGWLATSVRSLDSRLRGNDGRPSVDRFGGVGRPAPNKNFVSSSVMRHGIFWVCSSIVLTGCSASKEDLPGRAAVPQTAGPAACQFHFADQTQQSNLNFKYRSGTRLDYAPILEDLGGGCGLLDMDRDGLLDAFFPGGGSIDEGVQRPFPHGFFQNIGAGTFRDISIAAEVAAGRHYSHGVASSDFDADGFPDLLVTGYGGLQLFHNQGDGTFVDQTDSSMLSDTLWSTSAAWGDVNSDGNPDLYVCHYVDWSPQNDPVCPGPSPERPESCPPAYFKGLPDTLYLSGGAGQFDDVSHLAGLRKDGKGLGVVIADLDLDGDADIYVANDTVANFVYRNDGNQASNIPIFTEIGVESGAALSESGTADGSMGVAILNLNKDTLPDLWVSNFEFETPGLYRNSGKMSFTHVTRKAGLAKQISSYVSFGTSAADFDGDGDDDVLVTNGHISRYPRNGPVRQPCQLFENLGQTTFRELGQAGPCLAEPMLGRGLATGDIDGDGDPDAILSPRDESARLFVNLQERTADWLVVGLCGTNSPRSGEGVVITRIHRGTRSRLWCYSGQSYLSACSLWLCIPDPAPHEELELEVSWPSGRCQKVVRSTSRQWSCDRGTCRRLGVRLTVVEPES